MRLQPSGTSEAEAEDGGAKGGAEEDDDDDEGGIGSLCVAVSVSVLVAASCAVGPSVSSRSASTSETASMTEGVRLIVVWSALRRLSWARCPCPCLPRDRGRISADNPRVL